MALILASASPIRAHMLEAAGATFKVQPADVYEAAIKARHQGDTTGLAVELAAAKAVAVSVSRPGDWTIGSDSLVNVGARIFDKPRDRGEAVEHLRMFSGRPMILTSAVALVRSGEIEWSHVQSATLHVRNLSDAFVDSYLDAEWPEVGYCVGVFRMEGRGVQLFERIDGDHFTILGMPLLPLLAALRARGLMTS